jgi:hypothetical protein
MIVWLAAAFLELLVLVRSLLGRTLSKYPFFYTYVTCVLIADMSRYVVYRTQPTAYQNWYWGTEFVCVILGFSVLLEIIERGLAPFEGARKFARIAGLLVFGAIVAFTTIQGVFERHWASNLTSIEVERNLRVAELVLLAAILLVIFYYNIPVGRNLKGIIFGYGLYVAAVVMNSAVRSYMGESFHTAFSLVGTYSYVLSLLIWTVALWSYYADPVAKRSGQLEVDYQSFVLRTRNALDAMRSYLGKAGRP